MYKPMLQRTNLWLLATLGRDWLDYLASNTMTEFNRRYNDFIWTYELKALVTAVHDEAPGIRTFTLMPNQHWKGMQPGQHVAIHGNIDGKRLTRYYSATPTPSGGFTITLQRHAKGGLSDWLHTQVKPGSILSIEQAQGQFCFRQQHKLLMISAGTGITPCYSIVMGILGRGAHTDIKVYAQFRHQDQGIFLETLRDWQHAGIDVTTTFSRPSQQVDDSTRTPLLNADNFAERYPDVHERDIYLCGPAGFMDKIIAALRVLDYDMDRLHCERFTLAATTPPPDDTFDVNNASIYFRHLDTHVTLTAEDQGKSLLQIAERHAIPVESGCRQGMCGTCKLTVQEGSVSGNQLGNAVYLCSAYPASSQLVLDA